MIEFRRKIVLIFLKIKNKILNYQVKKMMQIYNIDKNDLLNCDFELWDDLKKLESKGK